MSNNIFQVFNASAGAGKTYSLVKSYLTLLLSSNNLDKFKHILAITFTNKAVAEMKQRILQNLSDFAKPSVIDTPTEMFSTICVDLDKEPESIHKKSILIRNNILNNYAAFDIVTLDRFTHRILRTFAHDLKLSQSFEVNLETEEVLAEAVQNVIQKIGKDNELTQVLIQYALHKTNDDKSWDIGLDLFKTAKLLLNENDQEHINILKNKTINDFKTLQQNLKSKITKQDNHIINLAKEAIQIIKSKHLEKKDFSGGFLFSYFEKLQNPNTKPSFETAWQNKLINGEQLYKKNTEPSIAESINQIQPQLADIFHNIKSSYFELQFLKNFEKNIIPLSVLFSVNTELQQVKDENNIILISEFNNIIYNEIKDQPAPFIYERLGNRYQNYFIDEFQDTSTLQWNNLVPLIDNALISESNSNTKNSLMIVGDAKQSIYRWRGGKPEQFIDLYEGLQPFYIKNSIINLDTNYRSYSEIITFNNNFFTHISNLFVNPNHQNLYKIGNSQKTNTKKGGYVNITFVNKEDSEDQYLNQTLLTIKNAISNNYNLKDICIITRRKSEGILIANHLSKHKIDIISSESLLLKNSTAVKFIISLLNEINLTSKQSRLEILYYLIKKSNTNFDEHNVYETCLNLNASDFFKYINTTFNFNYTQKNSLSLFEIVEDIIRSFNLITDSDAHIQYFLDDVFSFTQSKSSGGIQDYLEHWNSQKDKLSIIAPEGLDAVSIMTIHKSKGLEFPVVIFPFADLDIYKEHEKKTWLTIDPKEFNAFPEAYINLNKDLSYFSKTGEELYNKNTSELELDNINLLYVTLTRAKQELYIISKLDIDAKGNENIKRISGIFIHYLKTCSLWDDNKNVYTFGNQTRQPNQDIQNSNYNTFISSNRSDHNLSIVTKHGQMWDSIQQDAVEKGNLIHLILSKIKYKRDLDTAFSELIQLNEITKNQANNLKPIISSVIYSNELADFFNDDYDIYNEQTIMSDNNQTFVPDRICIKNQTAIIIDYKTGTPLPKHDIQIRKYGELLTAMNYNVKDKILVYLSPDIQFKYIS